jgi:hypothetical protein
MDQYLRTIPDKGSLESVETKRFAIERMGEFRSLRNFLPELRDAAQRPGAIRRTADQR